MTAALADDPRTDLAVIEVISERGIVTLKGKVDSTDVREAAEEITSGQPGVIKVINALEVEPDEDTPFLLSAEARAGRKPVIKPGSPIVRKLRGR